MFVTMVQIMKRLKIQAFWSVIPCQQVNSVNLL